MCSVYMQCTMFDTANHLLGLLEEVDCHFFAVLDVFPICENLLRVK